MIVRTKNYSLISLIEENYKNYIFLAKNDKNERFVLKQSKLLNYDLKNSSLSKEFHNFEAIGETPYSYKIVEYFVVDGREFLTSKFIDGIRLDKLIEEKKKLNPYDAISYIHQILKFFIILYDKGYLYRDLKPQNIIVTQNNELRLIDFELVEKIGYSSKLTQNKEIEGSLLFNCSLKRVNGEKEDMSTEIYSIGMLLYYLVTGETILEGDTFEDLINTLQDKDSLNSLIKNKIKAVDSKINSLLSLILDDKLHNNTISFAKLSSLINN